MIFSLIQIGLKIAFLALLYLFLFSLIKRIGKDLEAEVRTEAPAIKEAEREPRLIVLDSLFLDVGRIFDIADELSLGRDDSNDVRMVDDYVSKEHALIYVQDDKVFLDDLGSANGITLNGERLWRAKPLAVGDKIQIGRTLFEFLE